MHREVVRMCSGTNAVMIFPYREGSIERKGIVGQWRPKWNETLCSTLMGQIQETHVRVPNPVSFSQARYVD